MEIRPVTNSDIEKSKNNAEIVHLTILQVIKDFEQFGIPVNFPDNLEFAYDELFDQLESHISNLIENNLDRLYSLLYRIDISDGAIRKQQTIRFDLSLAHIITDLILQREFRKVLFRLYFKQQQEGNNDQQIIEE